MRHRQFLRCQCLKQSRESSSLQPTAKDSGSDNNGNRYLPQRASNPLGKVFCSLLFRHRRGDTVVAMPFLYCTIKLLACICSQVVFFRTLPLAPSGGDRWFYADRKMRVSEYKGSLLALLNENILFKVPKTSAYGRFLNAKRS